MILVTTGTQLPFDRLIMAIDELAPSLNEPVFAQIGVSGYRPRNIEWTAKLHPAQFDERMRAASLVVSHAGIGTILRAKRYGKPIILFPRQVIHGDFNPHNLLADASQPDRLTGILDFGDMTLSHRICDLAVAASYLIEPADPTVLLVPLTQAYHMANPLTAQEIALLPDLITARLATTLTISAWRATSYPENAAYILRNAPTSRAGLDALTDPATLATALEDACERSPG